MEKNTADIDTLMQLGVDIGLNANELFSLLNSKDFSKEVAQDIAEAQYIGVQGVPFFVINRKYGISGAQETETFTRALKQAWEETQKITS